MEIPKKLNPPRVSVAQVTAAFDLRRRHLLMATAGGEEITGEKVGDVNADIYGNRAIANLALGRFLPEANARLRRTAAWFEHPHPAGRTHDGECDFAAMKLCRAYHLFRDSDRLEAATRKAIRGFFLGRDFASKHHSENHELLFRTSRYLMAWMLRSETFEAYGKTGAALVAEDAAWLLSFIRYRAERGWGEFDSSCYFSPDWECMISLYDFCGAADRIASQASPEDLTRDVEIQRQAGRMLDLLLTDMAVDSLNGMYGGAHGRIYQVHALDHRDEGTFPLQYLYFGNVEAGELGARGTLVDAVTSRYRPHELVIEVALDRPDAYENRERKHLHNTADVRPVTPVPGSIRKVTYYTPHYVLGTVQFQDDYPEDCRGKWYAHHEQHEWDLSLGTRSTARIFTHHPGEAGPEHGYWTGDIRCCCGHFFQNRSAALALYDIPANQPFQFIHAYLPRHAFDEVVEDRGFLFVREGNVFAALKLLGGHAWTTEGEWKDIEVTSPGGRNGAVCEAGLAEAFGSFAAFRQEIAANELRFDATEMRLTYASRRAGRLVLDTKGTREVDGAPADLEYATYDCPYLKSAWGSGVVEIVKGERRLVLDFTSP